MTRDPIVEEIKAVRGELAAKFDYDTRRMVEDVQRRQSLSGSQVVSFQNEKPLVIPTDPTPTPPPSQPRP